MKVLMPTVFASLLFSCAPAQADSLVLLGPSHHSVSEVNGHLIDNGTYGIGYEHVLYDNLAALCLPPATVAALCLPPATVAAQAMVYHDSFGSTSGVATLSYGLTVLDDLTVGLMGGLAIGYEDTQVPHIANTPFSAVGGGFVEVAMPANLSIGVLYMPDVCPDCTSTTTLYLKVHFHD